MRVLHKIGDQAKKPNGWFGEFFLNGMNLFHSPHSKWGLGFLQPRNVKEILELGCGGGKNIDRLLKLYETSKITGYDYSDASIKKSTKYNKKAVEAGRCTLIKGRIEELPFQENRFDLITAFETIYFWENIQNCFKKIHAILAPKGQFLICNECIGKTKKAEQYSKFFGDKFNIYNGEELLTLLQAAGFVNIEVHEEKKNEWLTIIAEK